VRKRIRKKLEELKKYPERGNHLKYSAFWALRIENYRIIPTANNATTSSNIPTFFCFHHVLTFCIGSAHTFQPHAFWIVMHPHMHGKV
jgi:hypothetical protein